MIDIKQSTEFMSANRHRRGLRTSEEIWSFKAN